MPPCTLPPKLTSVGWARKRKFTSCCLPGMDRGLQGTVTAYYAPRRIAAHGKPASNVVVDPVDHRYAHHLAWHPARIVVPHKAQAQVDRHRPDGGIEREYAGTGATHAILPQPVPQCSRDAPPLIAGADKQQEDMAIVAHRGDAREHAIDEGQVEALTRQDLLADAGRGQRL